MELQQPYYHYSDAVTPEPASTIIPVRDCEDGLEVYMTQRSDELLFLGGYYVFPGGKVDPHDSEEEAVKLCAGITPDQAKRALMSDFEPELCLAHWVAGIREMFEEAGILLVYDEKGNIPDFNDPEIRRPMDEYRHLIQDEKMDMNEMMKKEGMKYATDLVVYFSHWITPPGSPRRYDTRFFIAHVPSTQRTRHHTGEVQHGEWLTPQEALQKASTREWPMIPPTIISLRDISRHNSVDDLMSAMKR